MKNEIISNSISNLIEVIKEQQELILSHEGKIPQIELDIVMGNVRTLYERLMDLNKLNQLPLTPGFSAITEFATMNRAVHTDELIAQVSVATPVTELPTVETPKIPLSEVSRVSEEKKEMEQFQPEELIAKVEIPVEESTVEISEEAVMPQAALAKERSKEYTKPAAKVHQMASLFDEPVTVAGKFKESPSLSDKFTANKQDNSLAEKLLKNPLSDLKKSIGINEKFAFINELFDGDLNSYNESIDKLNNSSDFQNAITFLETELTSKYNWDGESESFQKLKTLVERRFSS